MRYILPVLLCFWFASRTVAQDVQVVIGKVADTRASSGESPAGLCEIVLRAVGDAVVEGTSIRSVRTRMAVDDTGRDLNSPKPPRVPYVVRSEDGDGIAKQVFLRNPARSATVIKVLEGELDLFHPTIENGGKIVLKNFRNHPGEFIESQDLKRANIKLIFVTKETRETAQKRLEAETAQPADAETPAMVRQIMLRRMFEVPSGTKNPVQFIFHDPESKLVDLAFLDASGKQIETRSTGHGPNFIYAGFDEELPPGAQLLIKLATPAAIKTVPFKFENIPLP